MAMVGRTGYKSTRVEKGKSVSKKRKQLKKRLGKRETFTGEFVRHGTKNGWYGPDKTVLLKDIEAAEGEPVADHLWFNFTKGFEALGKLQAGDVIRFDARVTRYQKGYFGRREDVYKPAGIDYRLSRPTKISLVQRGAGGDQL